MTLRGILECRLCGEKLEKEILSLGRQPLSNALLTRAQISTVAKFPLDFRICSNCSLGQIGEFVSQETIFSEYTYLSSTSSSWLKHARDFVEKVILDEKLTGEDLVLEIASNDGYLLQYFKDQRIEVLGIEPAFNVAKIAIAKGIETRVEFFNQNAAIKLLNENKIPKLVICNNVLAHVPSINDFFAGLAILIEQGAKVSIEAPSLKIMLENNYFDTIYHEHFSYLSATSVNHLAKLHNVSLTRIEKLATHGGSNRYWIDKQGSEIDESVATNIIEEAEFGLTKIGIQHKFASESQESIEMFYDWCINQENQPIGFGAAAKATVLLNAANIRHDLFEAIADNALYKQDKLIPGSNIPIYSPEKVLNLNDRNLVIFPWNIADEISIEIIKKYSNFRGEIWTTLPKMRRIR